MLKLLLILKIISHIHIVKIDINILDGKLCKLCLSKHKKDYLILGLPFVMSTTVLFDKRNQ